MEINKKILEHINRLKTNPATMFVDDKSYYAMKTFVMGFVMSLSLNADDRFVFHLNRWHNAKYNRDGSIDWIEVIKYVHEDKTDEELRLILLNNLEEYFIKNPDWQNISEV